ncbi:lamin tail domain-containing protein [Bacillus sp. DX1.1]|uniref:lamin tail domain-containing protein n=1 Tax=unclassified Bacillus (in: firmicutes) TaxID=185979 RepID=UPI002570CADF|nr:MULTISPECIES: lamin tail domain-containing protein [unclassified Bacillus (in: firmicutes)]MDM5153308.1 lamin tail domain-containing protein [Bacillus sp. DX1.1]WJE82266.1 lamin tail domain-containing protein [Bacillus sp. DX3.1]
MFKKAIRSAIVATFLLQTLAGPAHITFAEEKEQHQSVLISEVHYTDEFRYIELYNSSTKVLDMSKVQLKVNGKELTFKNEKEKQSLQPKETKLILLGNKTVNEVNEHYKTGMKEDQVLFASDDISDEQIKVEVTDEQNKTVDVLEARKTNTDRSIHSFWNDTNKETRNEMPSPGTYTIVPSQENEKTTTESTKKESTQPESKENTEKQPVRADQNKDEKPHQETSHVPKTKVNAREDLPIEFQLANTYDDAKVNIVYQSASQLLVKKQEMKKGENNLYSTVVPKLDIWSDTFTYWFEIEENGKVTVFPEKERYASTIQHQAEDYTRNRTVMITELMPDTINVNGKDGYEFIEIYNNSSEAIQLKDYKLIYKYSENGSEDWNFTENTTIPSKGTVVFWIKNGENTALSKQDFIQAYGGNIKEEQVIQIETDGMSNSGGRTIQFADQYGTVLSSVTYEKADVKAGQSVAYAYGPGQVEMYKVGLFEKGTPGLQEPFQVPLEPVKQPEQDEITIEHTAPGTHTEKEDLTITATIKGGENVQNVAVLYTQDGKLAYKKIQMNKEGNGDVYKATIPAKELWGNSLFYKIVVQGNQQTIEKSYETKIEHAKIDSQSIPPFLITEVTPDTTNVGKADGYEFIEVYNNSNQDINFKDYTIRYRYPAEGPEGDLIWGSTPDDVVIPSGQSLVFWIITGENNEKTVADFNKQFGANLIENKNIVRIYSNGMANGSSRGIIVATKTGKEIAAAYYNDEANPADVKANKGILYRYPQDGSQMMQKVSGTEHNASPGTVLEGQVPAERVALKEDTIAPTISHKAVTEPIAEFQDHKLTFGVLDNEQVKAVKLYYKTNLNEEYKAESLVENRVDKKYHYTIYSPELIGKENITYYVEASDGINVVKSDTYTVQIAGEKDKGPLRLNVKDDEVLANQALLKGTSSSVSPEQVSLSVDGKKVETNTYRALEKPAYFAFDVKQTDLYFKNAVTIGNEVLRVFDDTYRDYVTLTVKIDQSKIKYNEPFKIDIRSGTKSSPFDDRVEENKDDFYVKNVRLVLADGTTLYDPNFANPNQELSVGDGETSTPVFTFGFQVPEDKFISNAYLWDTKQVKDGKHQIAVQDGVNKEVVANVKVDNTPPQLSTTVQNGKKYKGKIPIDVTATDDIAGVKNKKVILDGKEIVTPYETSSGQLDAGKHELHVEAEDQVGNRQEKTIVFETWAEDPTDPTPIAPKDEEENVSTNATLEAKVTDPTNDAMKATFYKGYTYKPNQTDRMKITENAIEHEPPQAFEVSGEKTFNQDQLSKISKKDGEYYTTESIEKFPYHRFDVTVADDVKNDDKVEVKWYGHSLEGRKVTMYAWNYTNNKWTELTSKIAGDKDFELKGAAVAKEYVKDKKVSVIVQDQIPSSPDKFDYTFVWMSDTQYYAESYPHIYKSQVDWIAAQKKPLNIQYVFHTGDLVDKSYQEFQWQRADEYMKVLENANVPYGVLAGNHDVNHKDEDYTAYSKYFGDWRFKDKSYYGESYKDNRGHYDLISAKGNDFIMIYMGWGVTDEDIQWVKDVLQKYPNRKAILSFHEYLLVSGNRSPIGDKIFNEVVKPNKNILAVLSGHYHDSETLVDEIDDNGDGVADRKVYQMLADYQGGPEGGQGYMRLLQFDTTANKMYVKTYSPYLNEYNFYKPEEHPGKDEFELDVDLKPAVKQVVTDYVEVNVYTDEVIGKDDFVANWRNAKVKWQNLKENTTYHWYIKAEDRYGGQVTSPVWSFTTGKKI